MEKRRGHFIWKVSEQRQLKLMKCTLMPVKENCRRIWIAVNRHGKRFLDFVIGDRSGKNNRKILKQNKTSQYEPDCKRLLETVQRHYSRKKHLQTKAETNIIK
ncbi:hypothetical protein Barb6XT_03212 [Bacteroidales bacterium Barb6XT]|nr:hypothetical protein Barb6XT_03212 [Bacteroidales bacterium Barb6XT]